MRIIHTVTFLIFGGVAGMVAARPGNLGQPDTREKEGFASFQVERGSTHHGPPMRVEFENDLVQVIRIRIAPHEMTPMHEISSPRVQILLTDEHLKIIFPNGEIREERHKAGETAWLEPQKHAGENLSDSPLEFITVVPKKQ